MDLKYYFIIWCIEIIKFFFVILKVSEIYLDLKIIFVILDNFSFECLV